MEHLSVLKPDVKNYLQLEQGEIVVDATLGLGGHALDLAEAVGESGKLIAFDQDARNLEEAKKRLKKYQNHVSYQKDNFRYLKRRITGLGLDQIDAILFDLGLSSPHVDDSERGFSFLKDGPLDMRFDQDGKLTAAEVINTYKEEDLVRIFFEYGEEKMARKIAREICQRRVDKKFSSTVEFAEFVEACIPKKFSKKSKSHPATKIFQAIRMEVNDELEALKEALQGAVELLRVGGRIVIISYHSLEDRIVKHFFKELERPLAKTEEENMYSIHGEPIFESLTKKPIVPSDLEIKENPRSRSAKLRAYKKLRTP